MMGLRVGAPALKMMSSENEQFDSQNSLLSKRHMDFAGFCWNFVVICLCISPPDSRYLYQTVE